MDALLLASYTQTTSYDDWLGGIHAYRSQTKQAVKRLLSGMDTLYQDITFVGHVSERFARTFTWSQENITKYSSDPVKTMQRLNYHACVVARTTGEMLVGLDDQRIYVECSGANIRSLNCNYQLQAGFNKNIELLNAPSLLTVCPLSNVTGSIYD